jgi:hypothetical protein
VAEAGREVAGREAVVVDAIRRNPAWMARKSSIRFQGKPAAVSKKQAIDQIYDSIAEELRTQYNLGYTPDKANAEAGYHKITLVAKQKDLVVQTRDGYYAEREGQHSALSN